MNQEESLRRRISSILGEVERRGFEAVVFLNEVIGHNPRKWRGSQPDADGELMILSRTRNTQKWQAVPLVI